MSGDLDAPVLWLRDPNELDSPPSRHAILWPAIEYTVLVFGRSEEASNGPRLDPFERAIVGAAAANVVSVHEQARIFDLNPQFVGHIHQVLQERGILDRYSLPRDPSSSDVDDEILLASRIYLDPWSGTLWPRVVTDERRHTLAARTRGHRLEVEVGTTGEPIILSCLPCQYSGGGDHEAPTSDDAGRTVRDWRSTQRQPRNVGLPRKPAVRVLPDTAQQIWLCCPNHRGASGRPNVLDPFGGPGWAPLLRNLKLEAAASPQVKTWLFGTTGMANQHAEGDDRRARLKTIGEQIADIPPRREGLNPQVPIDLEDLAHQALDLLGAPSQPNLCPVDDGERADDLLRTAALTAGFSRRRLWPPGLLAAASGEGSRELLPRCMSLLLTYTATEPGPLHQLAQRDPQLFWVLGRTNRVDDPKAVRRFYDAVSTLLEVAEAHAESTLQG